VAVAELAGRQIVISGSMAHSPSGVTTKSIAVAIAAAVLAGALAIGLDARQRAAREPTRSHLPRTADTANISTHQVQGRSERRDARAGLPRWHPDLAFWPPSRASHTALASQPGTSVRSSMAPRANALVRYRA
jgi:hypothetical protein